MPSNLAVRDIETLIHPYTNLDQFRQTGPLVIERGQGVHVYDTDGKAYIEGMAGLWCTALGYGNEELIEAAAAQEEDHQPDQGLSRHHHRVGLAHRVAQQSDRLRCADREHLSHRMSASLPLCA